MASSTCSSSSVPETHHVLEGHEFSEANNMLLMALMEDTQEDDQYHHDMYYADNDKLMNMIQSLEAEISNQRYGDDIDHHHHHHMGHMDGQDYSTSSVCTNDDCWTMDMEMASASSSTSSSPFEEEMNMMSAWSPCDNRDFSEFYHGLLLENSYLPQETSNAVF